MNRLVNIITLMFVSFVIKSQTTFYVTSTNDPVNPFNTVAGELRYAINQANASPGTDIISFNISGAAPKTIILNSDLPIITDPVLIDGNSQPLNGYSGIEKRVKIKSVCPTNCSGGVPLSLYNVSSSYSAIKNLEIEAFGSFYAICLFNGSSSNLIENNVIYSNWVLVAITGASYGCNSNLFRGNIFGTDINFQKTSQFNNKGFFLGVTSQYNNTIGGLNTGDANYFYNMDHPSAPVDIQKGSGNRVNGNFFINNAKNIDIYTNNLCQGNICKPPPVFTLVNNGGVFYATGTSAPSDLVEIYKSDANGIDAIQLLGTGYASAVGGAFNIQLTGLNPTERVIGIATDNSNNTSEFTSFCSGAPGITIAGDNCSNTALTFSGTPCLNSGSTFNWNFGDGTSSALPNPTHVYSSSGVFNVQLTIQNPPSSPIVYNTALVIDDCPEIKSCRDCISSFSPEAGDYIVSLWVKEDGANAVATYQNAGVKISFVGSSVVYGPFYPDVTKNKIIDGWQRIDEKFTVPSGASQIKIELVNGSSVYDSYYDDIRIHPVNASFKSYVYDPVTLRLVAELDDRNYATFYEYDEEGQLVRVKKETEKGIKTIKESRTSVKK